MNDPGPRSAADRGRSSGAVPDPGMIPPGGGSPSRQPDRGRGAIAPLRPGSDDDAVRADRPTTNPNRPVPSGQGPCAHPSREKAREAGEHDPVAINAARRRLLHRPLKMRSRGFLGKGCGFRQNGKNGKFSAGSVAGRKKSAGSGNEEAGQIASFASTTSPMVTGTSCLAGWLGPVAGFTGTGRERGVREGERGGSCEATRSPLGGKSFQHEVGPTVAMRLARGIEAPTAASVGLALLSRCAVALLILTASLARQRECQCRQPRPFRPLHLPRSLTLPIL
jgi:hypothetical protein